MRQTGKKSGKLSCSDQQDQTNVKGCVTASELCADEPVQVCWISIQVRLIEWVELTGLVLKMELPP